MVKPSLAHLATRYVWERQATGSLTLQSARGLRYTLGGFLRSVGVNRRPRTLSEQDVVEWLAIAPWGPRTARHRLCQLHGFLAWMAHYGYVSGDATWGVRGPRLPVPIPRALPKDAVAGALASACPDARGRVMVLSMVQEGMRCCEVARLEVGDLNARKDLVLVRGKGRRERVLPLSPETGRAVRDYLAEWPAKAGPLIRSYNHPRRGITAAWVSQLVSGWLRVAGIDATAHALRHTAATDMLLGGAHVRDVQAALGHARLSTTERYLPWLVDDLREAMSGRWYGGPPEAA